MNLLFQFAAAITVAASLQSSVVPSAITAESRTQAKVDLVELNHFLDDHGREVFRQVVFYDWSGKSRQFEVRAWRLVKHPSQLPRQQHRGEGFVVRWQDKHVTREVIARTMRETFSQDDPERINRHILPENERRPLWPSGE